MSMDVSRLRIVQYPDPVLRKKATRITQIDDDVRAVARRMIELMHEREGVGLAAPQVGLSWRMFVTYDPDRPGQGRVYINPTLTPDGREMAEREEGCLSIPGVHADVYRHVSMTMTATDEHAEPVTVSDADFLARVWQHENDHLDGVLIIDKMNTLDRLASRKTLKELKAAADSGL
jgi:peptide deformylase